MVVHTRLRERKERERKKEREERCNRRRNALNTITGFSTMFYLTKQTRSMNHPGTHDTKSLFDFGTVCVCVCVCVCARAPSNDVSRVSDDAIKLTKKKNAPPPLQFSNLIGVNFLSN